MIHRFFQQLRADLVPFQDRLDSISARRVQRIAPSKLEWCLRYSAEFVSPENCSYGAFNYRPVERRKLRGGGQESRTPRLSVARNATNESKVDPKEIANDNS